MLAFGACYMLVTKTYSESNLSISAWEYDAPTTIFGSRPAGVVTLLLGAWSRTGGRQNGEADL